MKQPTQNTTSQAEEPPHMIGYARVSTRDQDPQMQINALIAAGVHESDIYYETASGASKRRPQFDAMMKDAREGDIILFWKLDRLGRSVKQVLDTIEKLDAKGARIRCLTQPIDTTTAMGRLILTILAAVAEMERELGLERTRAGLARAKAEGRLGGATAKWSHQEILDFAKLGIRPGAKAAKLSVPGFQKALIRARKWKAEKDAKRGVNKAKRKAKR
jgi:DNA invertase Pin-like site-specific DNA recombinase